MSTKVLSDELTREAVTMQLRALSLIDDNQIVSKLKRVPEGWEIQVVKDKE